MRSFETYLIWGISLGILFISNFNPIITLISVFALLILVLKVKDNRFTQFKKKIANNKILFFSISNIESKKTTEFFILPISLVGLLILIILNYDVGDTPLWIIFFVLPLIPAIFQWIINIIYSKYSYGLSLLDDGLMMGFDGLIFNYSNIDNIKIENQKFEITVKGSRKTRLLEFNKNYINELSKLLIDKEVKVVNK